MQRLYSNLLQLLHHQRTMTTPFKDYNQSFTGSGTESLSALLQDQARANRPSVGTYVLTCLTKENGSVTWHLKSQTVVQLSDLCPPQSVDPSISEILIDLS